MIERGAPLVETDAGNAGGLARSSRLTEILFGENLKASADARTAHPNPPGTAPDHATMLNKAEKRLVTEWMDLGGQYYNDLHNGGSGVRLATLSETTFRDAVQPILQANCAICHQPVGNSGAAQTPTSFRNNRFILTGSAEGGVAGCDQNCRLAYPDEQQQAKDFADCVVAECASACGL